MIYLRFDAFRPCFDLVELFVEISGIDLELYKVVCIGTFDRHMHELGAEGMLTAHITSLNTFDKWKKNVLYLIVLSLEDNIMKIVAFLCTWCSYAGADLAGTGRNQYPPNIRVIRIPCSGRINPLYIIKALLEGADGVMVSGCHPGDCHYLVGNYYARRRFVVLKKLLTTAGFDADLVHFTWVSASEGTRFADAVRKVTEMVSAVSANTRQGDGSSVPVQHETSNIRKSCNTKTKEPSPCLCLEQEAQLISLCGKLFKDGTVSSVIGFQAGGETGLSIPVIIDSADETDKLVWNNRCVPNLGSYLLERKEKTGIIAKPCDARAIVNLIVENQLKREDVYIIGMTCEGMVNEDSAMLPACLDCRAHIPPVYDILIGEAKNEVNKKLSNLLSPLAGELKNTNPLDTLDTTRFKNEMSKCILCYSCRQSCYGCYCKTCFMERGEPDWQTASPDMGAKMLYHLGRATHLSGRCVECGACENACASGVDIRYLIKSVTDFIDETYNYQTGMDLEAEPVMLIYKADDPEIGFLSFTNDTLQEAGGGADA